MKKKDGFPEALFDNFDQLVELSAVAVAGIAPTDRVAQAFLWLLMASDEDLQIGRLRQADPILGEMVVAAREMNRKIMAHLEAKAAQAAGIGGVTLDQA